ncbi:MAG: PDZ domain-containing protein, partial [Gemmatimonadota bacterium]
APAVAPAPEAPPAPAARPAPDARLAPAAPPLPPTASAGWELSRRRGDDVARLEYRTVARLKLGGAAWRAGVREGDQVVAVDGRDGRLDSSVIALLYKRPGSRYTLRFRRGGVEREVVAEVEPARGGRPAHY